MSRTYSQLYIHIIFAVKGRENLIAAIWKDELYRYIAGTIKSMGHKSIIINGASDHVHCFIGLNPNIAISDLVKGIKSNSSRFINDRKFVKGKFQWQEGYGAFSYGQSQINQVYHYIYNQEEHHKKQTFREEYIDVLNKFKVDVHESYLFDWIEL
jgi:REP element-mobilizing transposase RayT